MKKIILSLVIFGSFIFMKAQQEVHTNAVHQLLQEIADEPYLEEHVKGTVELDFSTNHSGDVHQINVSTQHDDLEEVGEDIRWHLENLTQSDKKVLRENESYSFIIHYQTEY